MKKFFLILAMLVGVANGYLQASENEPTKEEVAKLYVATFNRAPDAAGLNYWVEESGLTLSQIARSFFVQPETQTVYPPSTTTEAFIRSIYANLFNREPDAAGLAYWKAELDKHRFSRSHFIQAVVDGALGNDALILENKTKVGLAFAEAGYNGVRQARIVLSKVDDSNARVAYALKKLAAGLPIDRGFWDDYDLPVFTSSSEVTVPENETFVMQVQAKRADRGKIYYSLSERDRMIFRIDAQNGKVWFLKAPDYEKRKEYHFTVTAHTLPSPDSIKSKRERGKEASMKVAVHVSNVVEPMRLAPFVATIHESDTPKARVGMIHVLNAGEGNVTGYTLEGTDAFYALDFGYIINTKAIDVDQDKVFRFRVVAYNDADQNASTWAQVKVVKDNTPPVAFDQNISVYANTVENIIDLNATDAEDDHLTYTVVDNPIHGTLTGTAPNLLYTPEHNYTGTDSFTFLANDGREDSEIATVNIKIKPSTIFEDFEQNDSLDKWERGGSVVRSGSDSDEGQYSLLLTSNGLSATSIANAFNDVTVSELNAAAQVPLSNGAYAKSNVFLNTGDMLKIRYNFIWNDYAPYDDAGLIIIDGKVERLGGGVDLPDYGETGWRTYTYTATKSGWLEFGFAVMNAYDTVYDSNLKIDSIIICRKNSNTPPVAIDQNITVEKNSSDNPIELNATDADGDPLTFTIVDEPQHGTLDGTPPHVTYTPEPGYTGEDSFTFIANDGEDESNEANVTIIVTCCCIDDNFDNEPVGSLPEGWVIKYNGTGNSNQKIVDTVSHSAPHSFQLEGAGGWAANIYKELPALSGWVTVEAYVNMDKVLSSGDTGWMGLYNKDVGTWGTLVGGLVYRNGRFGANYRNGNLYDIGTFEEHRWYAVKIVYDLANRTYQIYIDGTLKAGTLNGVETTTFPMHPTVDPMQIMLTAGNGGRVKVFYDDVKVSQHP